MKAPLILGDWNGHLIPFVIATPVFAIGCLLLLVAGILSNSKTEDEKKTAKTFATIGGCLLAVAVLVIIFGKDSVS